MSLYRFVQLPHRRPESSIVDRELGRRKKALCCTPNLDLLAPASCDEDLCLISESFSCEQDPYEDDFSDEDQCDPADCFPDEEDVERRDFAAKTSTSSVRDLVKRAQKREFELAFTVGAFLYIIEAFARRYPGASHLNDPTRGPRASTDVFRSVLCSTSYVSIF